ncbi:MAG: alpha/beta hydrolase [Betaproteobacteria bacterium HGW-Betaproteobacteria-2]|nr:MAG: alpha/beta hydrolase [Betaproteobacteria bacterium HGW-Betaproteobacteria-2]
MPVPAVSYRREVWLTPDDDFIELDWLKQEKPVTADQPLVVLFHGLEGSSQSHYAKRIMAAVGNKDWRGVVVHFRGCGGKANRQPRSYHCGDSAEIDWILQRFRRQEHGEIYAVGVSLGGNVLLKWLGEQKMQAGKFISKAAAISTSLDLPATGKVLGLGFNRLYSRIFLKTLQPKALDLIRKHRLDFDYSRIQQADNLWDYDNLFTAPLHGFHGADDYWQQSSCRPYLRDIWLPTLLINARNDPFLPEQCLPSQDEVSSLVSLDFPRHGGHAGFVSTGSNDWLAERLLRFLYTDQNT